MWEGSGNDVLCQDYADPVGRLLTIGDGNLFKLIDWPDYPEQYQLGHQHVPALIRMACDMALHNADEPEVWAPVHAWRALAQMRATEAIEPLLEFMKIPPEDDAVSQEFSTVFGMIGPAVIAPIAAFLDDRSMDWLPTSIAAGALKEIAKRHPECREECVGILTGTLRHADADPTANGFAIGYLLDLAAVESIDVIREAFRLDAVDISIAGDLEDVEVDLGLRQRRATPKPYYPFESKKFASPKSPAPISFSDTRQEIDASPRPMKVGRNEPCPCGSGKKYKKCCLE